MSIRQGTKIIAGSAGNSGTTDYTKLTNKPSINGIVLEGNKTTEDLGIISNKVTIGHAGQIGYTTRTELPEGCSWCDGSEYTKDLFPDIYQMLVDNKLLNTDYETFNNLVSAGNSCGYFALDTSAQKFKVPFLQNVYIKTGDTTLGFVAESLPNIKGKYNIIVNSTSESGRWNASGAFYRGSSTNVGAAGENANGGTLQLDASKYDARYQDGAKINPDHVVYRAYVILYNNVVDDPSSVNKAAIWAEGTDEEVQKLGGTKSAKSWAETSEQAIYKTTTNCITKIPQNIKLELSNGTLTLKAGSKVYYGNGDGTFSEYIIPIDLINSSRTTNLKELGFIRFDTKELEFLWLDSISSGDTAPTVTTQWWYWYDTVNKQAKYTNDNGASWINCSLPFGVVISNTSQWTSIDQVFNGFGYIGSTLVKDGGNEYVFSNGRNTDGSLNNIKKVLPNLTTWTIGLANNISYTLFVRDIEDNRQMEFFETSKVYKQDSQPTPIAYAIWYSPRENKWRYILSDTSNGWLDDWIVCEVATFSGNAGRITSFSSKTTFQAVDRNDSEWASTTSKPSSRYVDLTLQASGTKYTAPANGWFYFDKAGNAAGQFTRVAVNNMQSTKYSFTTTANSLDHFVPVKKGDVVTITYSATGATVAFRFIYDEGAK